MKRSSAGYTLLEVMIAMMLGSVVLSLLAATMARVLGGSQLAQDHLQGSLAVARLAEQFRDDVHATRGVRGERADGRPTSLVLELRDGVSVTYSIDPSGLLRAASVGETPRSRELFFLPGMKVLDWNDDSASSRRVSIDIGRLSDERHPHAIRSRFSIDAVLANDFDPGDRE